MATLVLEVESRSNLESVQRELLPLERTELTVAELIAERVRHKALDRAPGRLNEAVDEALDAFRRGAFLLIVDGVRRTDPEERLRMTSETRVRFWRLVPLVGG